MVYDIPAEKRAGPSLLPCRRAGQDVPIVIDNGTDQCRAGYSNAQSPNLVFDNVFSKYRSRATNTTYHVAGDDVLLDPLARAAARSPYDGAVVTNWDTMEGILDYIFIKLGLEDADRVNPIILTETLCNVKAARRTMTEMLFECYNTPSVAYGIDSLFSYYENDGRNGVVVSSGHLATTVIPVVNGSAQIANSKRLSLGGTSIPDYMLRLAQLKYPSFPTKVSSTQAQLIAREHCYTSPNYNEELKGILTTNLKTTDRAVQFPFVDTTEPEKTAEELAIIAQRKFESGVRLREAAAAKRLEKLIQQEQDLEYYLELKSFAKSESKKDFAHRLQQDSIETEAILDNRIKSLEASIKKARNKDLGIVEEEVKQIPDFSLIDIPDSDLTEVQLKQKRTQKLMKYGYDARIRAKTEKEAQKRQAEELLRLDIQKREREPHIWIQEKRLARQQVLDKIKERQKLKAELNDRKSLASQMRMKQIAGLASTTDGKRKRKNDDDNFGMNDDDWHVYRDVGNDSESEGEEEDTNQLRVLETELLQHDPEFSENDTIDAKADPSKSLLHAFYNGPYDPEAKHEMAMDYQLHFNVERIRAPEIIYCPSLVGMDQCGLVEMVKDIMSRIQPDQRSTIVKDFFTTGGNTLLSGFNTRLRTDLVSILPAGQTLKVRTAKDARLDAWRGAAKWATHDPKYKNVRVSRAEYEEMGGEYMKEHGLGNLNI